ncbi:MAG TPA: hypothetical protein VNV66_02830, partial [Pilimelia sp.]|nr:hypothetical protein [Pilimelia sp.]
RPEPGRKTVLFGGGRLAADLSLPQLDARWAATSAANSPAGEPGPGASHVRAELWSQATTAVARAADAVRACSPTDPEQAGDIAAAAGGVLTAAARLVDGPDGGPMTTAARLYDRAARKTYRRTPSPSDPGRALRGAALQLARADRRPGKQEAAHVAVLLSQITRLTLAVSRLREAQGLAAQATAARSAALQLRAATSVPLPEPVAATARESITRHPTPLSAPPALPPPLRGGGYGRPVRPPRAGP